MIYTKAHFERLQHKLKRFIIPRLCLQKANLFSRNMPFPMMPPRKPISRVLFVHRKGIKRLLLFSWEDKLLRDQSEKIGQYGLRPILWIHYRFLSLNGQWISRTNILRYQFENKIESLFCRLETFIYQ